MESSAHSLVVVHRLLVAEHRLEGVQASQALGHAGFTGSRACRLHGLEGVQASQALGRAGFSVASPGLRSCAGLLGSIVLTQ